MLEDCQQNARRAATARLHAFLELQFKAALIALSSALCACQIVPPGADAGASANKEPGKPFSQNVCFQCALRSCGGSANACLQETTCSIWLNCVAACPTDDTGVAADGRCLTKCGLPVSAEVLYGCVQDFSTGNLLGCEQACEPL